MIRIAVCDDERPMLDIVARTLDELFSSSSIEVEIQKYHDPEALLVNHALENHDVLFLDIDMPKLSGFDIAKKIRDSSLDTLLVFVSAKHELVYDSFEFTPFYFVRKISITELHKELNRVVSKLLMHFRQYTQITILDSYIGETSVKLKDILYIQSEKHYLLYTVNNVSVPYKERKTIADLENILCEEYSFIKPHQRYLVNMNHIAGFDLTANQITLDNGCVIPISRKEKELAYSKYKTYKRR